MIDWILASLIASMSILLGFIYTKRAIENAVSDEIIAEKVKKLLVELLNDENTQKELYKMGGLIGSGARAGLGMSKGKGKFSIEDLMMQFASQFIGQWGQRTESSSSPPARSSDTLPPPPP